MEGEGQGGGGEVGWAGWRWLAGSLCDPLALWEPVQWKIVPTANPWQANYSFDPLGVCITIGGREATHSGTQYGYTGSVVSISSHLLPAVQEMIVVVIIKSSLQTGRVTETERGLFTKKQTCRDRQMYEERRGCNRKSISISKRCFHWSSFDLGVA